MEFKPEKVEEWLRYQELLRLLQDTDWKVIVNAELSTSRTSTEIS
jgi:hypothetical protein